MERNGVDKEVKDEEYLLNDIAEVYMSVVELFMLQYQLINSSQQINVHKVFHYRVL